MNVQLLITISNINCPYQSEILMYLLYSGRGKLSERSYDNYALQVGKIQIPSLYLQFTNVESREFVFRIYPGFPV